jgi:schlafen family protein
MLSATELLALLQFPVEKLTVEYKGWLDLRDQASKATLAKAAIALANEGGGAIVLGMREDNTQGRALRSEARPAHVGRYSQDDINSAINRYATPEFHCELIFANHPATNNEHAFVLVPGGLTVPVMSVRSCEGVITAHRCYVRKPGPRSEEPLTAEEWRGVMERCIAARRESMLDAIRIIVQGHGTVTPLPIATDARQALDQAVRAVAQPREDAQRADERADRHSEFERVALERWNQLIRELPQGDGARMIHGHYEISFQLLNVPAAASARELLRRMTVASQVRHTGWGPFVQIQRPEFAPRIVNENVEVWLGQPVEDRVMRNSAHCDYWSAHPSGLFFLLRGYEEDSIEGIEPGSVLDITLPIWRVGEALLYASRISRSYAENSRISIHCHYAGLNNRRLSAVDQMRRFFMDDTRICHDTEARLVTVATSAEIEDNLIEILHPLLAPLYERFRFFELPMDLVRAEITRMRASRF